MANEFKFDNFFAPSQQPRGITPNLSGLLPPIGTQSNTGTNSSSIDDYYDRLINLMPTRGQQNMTDLSALLGGFSSGKKADRITEGNFQGDYDQMLLNREADKNRLGLDLEDTRNRTGLAAQAARNDNETDALKKLQQTAYIAGGGSNFAPPSFQLGGQQRTAPSFAGIAPVSTTDIEKSGAMDLQGQVRQRLTDSGLPQTFVPKSDFTPDWSYTPKPVDSYAKPGLSEKLGSYGALGVGAIGTLMDIFGNGGEGAGGLSGLGSLGSAGKSISSFLSGGGGAASKFAAKALPIAGAVTGGLGLLKDRGTGSNIMNGLTAGSSIGTMIMPGLGTGIGAGVGALAGWARGLGGPSQEEVAGRGAASEARQIITSGATPQQVAEAQGAGWKNPTDALTMIVLRDKLGADKANSAMTQLYAAEKQGPQAVQSVIAQLMSGRA